MRICYEAEVSPSEVKELAGMYMELLSSIIDGKFPGVPAEDTPEVNGIDEDRVGLLDDSEVVTVPSFSLCIPTSDEELELTKYPLDELSAVMLMSAMHHVEKYGPIGDCGQQEVGNYLLECANEPGVPEHVLTMVQAFFRHKK